MATTKEKTEFDASKLTDLYLRKVAIAAVEEVLARRPVPSSVTLKQAAEMLDISPNTARKLGLRRNKANLIPYEEVLAARAARKEKR